jgi:hypothetical protein
MSALLRLVDDGDLFSTGLLVLILIFFGSKVVDGSYRLAAAGKKIAVLAFLAYVAYAVIDREPVFAGDWLARVMHGLVAAGLTLGISWITLPFISFLQDRLIRRPVTSVRKWHESRRTRRHQRQASLEAERVAALQQAEELRTAPDRMEAEEQARERAEAARREREQAQLRREDARAACVLLYGLHKPDIGRRYPRSSLDEFMNLYMQDDRPPQQVEERARQLQGIIREHLERVRPTPKFTSIEDIARWFLEQKQTIEALDLEDRDRRVHLALLRERYSELTTEKMEKLGT